LRLPSQGADTGVADAVRFVWRDHPSTAPAANFRIDLGWKMQEDARDPG